MVLRKTILTIILSWLVWSPEPGVSEPTPQESGWSVRLVAEGFVNNFNGLAHDPLSADLFTTDHGANTIYRVTQCGESS